MAGVSPQAPSITEAGKILADPNLTDWRAILYVLVFVTIGFFVFTVWREMLMHSERKLMADERKEIRALAQAFSESASKVADSLAQHSASISLSLGDLATKIAVLAALTGRAEATIARAQEESSHASK